MSSCAIYPNPRHALSSKNTPSCRQTKQKGMNQKDNNANVSGISTTADNSQTAKPHYESYEDIVSREMQPMKYQKCDNGIDMDEFWYSRSTAHAYQSGAQTAVQQPQTDAHAEKPQVKQAQKAEKAHRQNIRTEQKTAKKPAPEKPASATETPKHKRPQHGQSISRQPLQQRQRRSQCSRHSRLQSRTLQNARLPRRTAELRNMFSTRNAVWRAHIIISCPNYGNSMKSATK